MSTDKPLGLTKENIEFINSQFQEVLKKDPGLMKKIRMKFNILGALFSIGLCAVEIIIRIINILTWGKIGRMWMIKIELWSISSGIHIWDDK